MYTFSFERLEVWNRSRLLTKKIYLLTQKFNSASAHFQSKIFLQRDDDYFQQGAGGDPAAGPPAAQAPGRR